MIYGFILLIVLSACFILAYNITKDLFSPICFFSFLQILRYVPYLIGRNYESLTFLTLNYENTFLTFVFELLTIISIMVGYLFYQSFSSNRINQKYYSLSTKYYKNSHIIILFVLGMIGRLRVISFVGGLSAILSNGAEAYLKLSDGTGYLYLLSDCTILACVMQLSNIIQLLEKKKKTFKSTMVLVFMFLLYSASFVVFTSRSPILELLLYLIFSWHYCRKKITFKSILNINFLLIGLFFAIVIVILPRIRASFYNSSSNISGGNFISEFFDQFTYVGRDTFVYNLFGRKYDFWYGKSYQGLFTSFIPSTFYPGKPTVDDGVYLTNLLYGYSFDVPTSGDALTIKYSIPFSTSGLAYANFGVLGIIIVNFFLGILYGVAYNRAKKSKNVIFITIYILIIYQLEITTLSIVQTAMPAFIFITYYFIFGRQRKPDFSIINNYSLKKGDCS